LPTNGILFTIASIVLFGQLAQWIFRKTGVPDILLFLVVGFILGPSIANLANPAELTPFAPVFTTFTLLFIMFNGALCIDVRSFIRELGSGTGLSLLNYFLAAALSIGLFLLCGFQMQIAIFLGVALGGISSSFVIPILAELRNQEGVPPRYECMLTLESAFTDVLVIVASLTVMEVSESVFSIQSVLSQVVRLFAVAGVFGIAGGFFWIFLEKHVIERDMYYMMTIAYVVSVYLITEYFDGNGAIAVMFMGIVMANSTTILPIARAFKSLRRSSKSEKTEADQIVSTREKMFYDEISTFLKTFFFVYIGLQLRVDKPSVLLIASALAILFLIARHAGILFTREGTRTDRILVYAMSARGLAPAAVVLLARERGFITESFASDIVYWTIATTIVASSIMVIVYKRSRKKLTAA